MASWYDTPSIISSPPRPPPPFWSRDPLVREWVCSFPQRFIPLLPFDVDSRRRHHRSRSSRIHLLSGTRDDGGGGRRPLLVENVLSRKMSSPGITSAAETSPELCKGGG